jgi:hypothetical protein
VIVVESPHQRLDVFIRDHISCSVDYKQPLNLSLIYFSLILPIHCLEKLCDLEVTLTFDGENSSMKLLNLSLNLLFNSDFTLQKFGQRTEYIVSLFVDVTNVLSFYFVEEPRRHLLIALWDHKVDELFIWDSFECRLIDVVNQERAVFGSYFCPKCT